ncbi:MAG TPA: macrolide 2'-phosphotransferase, partial [Firmicutes bacterium]|nr:macrolide 2'-phosphotransferase [Bacillota bacterium]
KKYNLNILENSLIFNESGMDFLVVFAKDIYGKEWVLRFPRRDDVIQTTEVEKDILDLVNQNVNFEAPKWEIFQNDMIAYQKLKGFPMGTINHEIQDYEYEMDINNIPLCFYESFAKLLVDLHAISPDKVVSTQLTVFSTNEIREDMRCRMEKIKETLGVSEALWNRWQIWLNQDELWPKEVGFIHGDVHPGHILINSKSEVTGLIDWTEGKVSDISIDFVVFYKLFNESGLDKLISAYKNAGGYVWPKMKEHIIELTAASPVAIAEFALKSQLDSVMEYAKYELGIA